jgi:hypothetical protein
MSPVTVFSLFWFNDGIGDACLGPLTGKLPSGKSALPCKNQKRTAT